MSVSNQIAQARLDYFNREQPTRIEVRHEATATESSNEGLFGKDGLTFGDVLDAVNPLNHIPIISDVFASATGSKPSAASKLVGGTLMGGPIGFVASLATIIFEQATGASPTEAVMTALAGDDTSPSQVASAKQAQEEEKSQEVASATTNSAVQLAALSPNASAVVAQTQAHHVEDAVLSAKENGVLALYGDSNASAHESYRKAQLRTYLSDVTVSKVL